MNSEQAELVLVDSDTGESFKIFVNVQEVDKIRKDPSYKKNIINQIKKVRGKQSSDETNNLIELKLLENNHNKVYTLMVPVKVHDRALRDLPFATQLLNKHLIALNSSKVNQSTSSNVLNSQSQKVTNTAVLDSESNAVYELELIDQSTMESYHLFVDIKTFNRASKDMLFAAQLLEEHLEAINMQSSNSLSTNIVRDCNESNETDQISNSEELEQLITKYRTDEIENDKIDDKCTGRYVWTEPATLLLIQLYKENDTDYSEGRLTFKKFWKKIVDGMISKGYNINNSQCSSKMDALKRAYRSVKDHNAQSGNDRKTCNYYEELDDLFHKKPWIKPLSVAGSNMPLGNLDINKSSKNNLKRPKSVLETQKIMYLEKSLVMKRQRRSDTENYREKKLDIMRELAQSLKK